MKTSEQQLQELMTKIVAEKNLFVVNKQRIMGIIDKFAPVSAQEVINNQVADRTKEFHCLNEIVITRGYQSSLEQRLLKLELYINNKFIFQIMGDGLIVSTSTGSTAYALSSGGPLIENQVKSLLIVPICPQSLSFRPIVLPTNFVIMIKVLPPLSSMAHFSFGHISAQWHLSFTSLSFSLEQQVCLWLASESSAWLGVFG